LNLQLLSIGEALPGRNIPGLQVSNQMLASAVAQFRDQNGLDFPLPDVDFSRDRVGVNSRRFLDHRYNAYDMALVAARHACAAAAIDPERFRVVVVSSVTPPWSIPAQAALLQADLGFSNDLVAFDTPAGCNGYLAGLHLVRCLLLAAPAGSAGLLVTSEAMTRTIDATDRQTSVIFGDAAAATVLVSGQQDGLGDVAWSTQGSKGKLLVIEPGEGPTYRFHVDGEDLTLKADPHSSLRVRMDGRQVFKDMVTDLPRRITLELERRGRNLLDYQAIAFHQANQRIVDAVTSRLKISQDRVLSNIGEMGNTSSSSIPLMLAEASRSGRLRHGQRVLVVGFGTGYSVGVTELVWTAAPNQALELSSILPGRECVTARTSER
jgi:3-oxoacyl-[acyl-carrier-protein] synthase-3